MFSILAIGIAEEVTTTTLGLQIIVNNTNLAPTIEPNVTGTGERISGITYYNNNSDIEIFLYSHAATVSQTSDTELWINGTMISSVSSKPVGASPEQNNKSIIAIIPRYSAYKAVFANYHHYEWREYQILSGNISSTISSGGTCTGGCINQTQLDEKINKSGDIVSNTTFELNSNNSLFKIKIYNSALTLYSNDSSITNGAGITTQSILLASHNISSGNTSIYRQTPDSIDLLGGLSIPIYRFTNDSLNMGGKYTINSPSLDSKVNKSGDTFSNTTFMNITNGSYPESITVGFNGTPFSVWKENNTVRSILSLGGAQIWKLRTNDLSIPITQVEAGYISYSTPGNFPGILFYNASLGQRINIYMDGSNGLRLTASMNGSYNPTGLNVLPNGSIRIDKLAGTGNVYMCVDSTGSPYRGTPTC